MKRNIHELNDLLHGLVKDAELPEETSNVSEASRQRINEIVAEMNQAQEESVSMPKPVYSKPPKRKRVLKTPEPVSHFSEEPSQNPVVRMHDRLLQDAMPQPDAERKPVPKAEKKLKNKSSKKKKKAKSDLSQEKVTKKEFHIEIKEELPPDIPRDTTVADYIRQKQLEKTLASVPPRTPEQIRKEKVRKKAIKIREQMKQQEELIKQQEFAIQVPDSVPKQEEIPAWEDTLSELAEKTSAEELQVFEDAEQLKMPVLSDMPELPETSSEDTGLLKIAEKLKEVISDESKPVSELSEESKQEELKRQAGIFQKISVIVQNLFQREIQKSDFEEKTNENSGNADAVTLQTESVTEVLMTPKESDDMPDLSFEQTVLLQTVKLPKQEVTVETPKNYHKRSSVSKISELKKSTETVSVIQPKTKRKVIVSKRVKKSEKQEVSL